MAKMFPPEPGPSTSSDAEKRLFQVVKRELGNDWIVLHSVGLAKHRRKHWAEIDFVLIGPAGVYCVEVKGGRVARQDGVWLFTNRWDESSVKGEGPFEQANSAAHALMTYLQKTLPPWMRDVIIGWGTVFPDIAFGVRGPDIEPRLIYDVDDKGKPFSAYVRRLADYWHETLEASKAQPIETLTGTQIQQIFEVLRGDFDLRPSLQTRVNAAKDELIRLTEEQHAILEGLAANRRMLVRGSAGTGKTVLAAEEARRLASEGKRVLFSCYNKQLAHFLKMAMVDQPLIDVTNLHSFMARVVNASGFADRLPPASEEDLFAVFYPELTVESLLETERLGEYEALVVDEGQDLLLSSYLEVFDAVLDGGIKDGVWRVFLDHSQDIFGGTSPEALQELLVLNPAQYTLSVNCRNTKPIATVIRLISGAGTTKTLRVDGPEIEEHWYRDKAHQAREISKCINRLMSEGIRPQDITILSRLRLENSVLCDGLQGSSAPLKEFDLEDSAKGTSVVRFSTVQSFKGLEADAIVFVDIDDLESPRALNSFYVGSSRAAAYLALFMHESQLETYRQHGEEYGRRLAERSL